MTTTRPKPSTTSDYKIDMLLRDFRAWGTEARQWAQSTRWQYDRELRRFDRWLWEHKGRRLLKTAAADPREWLATFTTSAVARNNRHSPLLAFGDFMVDRGTWKVNHVREVPRLRESRPLPKAIEAAERDTLLAVAKAEGAKWYAAVCCMLYAGLRNAEVRNLDWSDIEGRYEWLRFVGKGSKERVLPIHPVLADALRVWKMDATHAGWVFPGRYGTGPMSQAWLNMKLVELGEAAGIVGLHPHKLRHTFATDLVLAGVHLSEVQHAMGHAGPSTTAVYVKVRPVQLADAIGQLK